jgi:hypothetical protein
VRQRLIYLIIAKKIIDGEDVPPIVKGRNAKIE